MDQILDLFLMDDFIVKYNVLQICVLPDITNLRLDILCNWIVVQKAEHVKLRSK